MQFARTSHFIAITITIASVAAAFGTVSYQAATRTQVSTPAPVVAPVTPPAPVVAPVTPQAMVKDIAPPRADVLSIPEEDRTEEDDRTARIYDANYADNYTACMDNVNNESTCSDFASDTTNASFYKVELEFQCMAHYKNNAAHNAACDAWAWKQPGTSMAKRNVRWFPETTSSAGL